MDDHQILREQLTVLLRGGKAHATFEDVLPEYPLELQGKKVPGIPYTAWELMEHIRIAQWDIVQYCQNAEHENLNWPHDYWSPRSTPPHENAWAESVQQIIAERDEMIDLINHPHTDLFRPLLQNPRHTVLREALLLADHNSYHLGQMVLIRKLLSSGENQQ
ncbi:MAG: DinB family protein [bacterium]|jgi:hypothetical protein